MTNEEMLKFWMENLEWRLAEAEEAQRRADRLTASAHDILDRIKELEDEDEPNSLDLIKGDGVL